MSDMPLTGIKSRNDANENFSASVNIKFHYHLSMQKQSIIYYSYVTFLTVERAAGEHSWYILYLQQPAKVADISSRFLCKPDAGVAFTTCWGYCWHCRDQNHLQEKSSLRRIIILRKARHHMRDPSSQTPAPQPRVAKLGKRVTNPRALAGAVAK